MKYTVNEQEKEITYDFVVPYDEYSVYVGIALEALCKQKNEEQMSLNDFIVKYGKDELNHVALNYAVSEAFKTVVAEKKLIVISQPRIKLGGIEPVGDATFSVTIDKAPEFTLGKYKGLEIQLQSKTPSVTVDEIERKKAQIAMSMSKLESVDGPLKNGQTSVIDFEGSVDGVLFEGGSAQNYELLIGSGMFIPGFEDQMVGMEKGEVRIVKVKFPDEYTPELAGKDADFKVTLHDIKEKKEVEINDGFAKSYGESKKMQINTIDELDKILREEIYREKEQKVYEETSDKLALALCENTEIDIPDNIVEEEVNYQLSAYENQAKQFGMELDMMVSMMGAGSLDELKAQLRNEAKKQLSLQLIID
ncbi:MAG: trigger factor [Clostridia bacterium]|nr:trigger factor [Clostridia bacterium]